MEEPIPSARITRRLRFSPVWLIPVLAIILSTTLLADLWIRREPVIEVEFTDGEGLREGITQLKYRGVKIGLVSALTLSEDHQRVIASIAIDSSAAGLAREGSRFWIVRPEVGIAGIRGLDTLISGPYIQIHPGKGPPYWRFTALTQPPRLDQIKGGLVVHLRAAKLGSLKPGAPVFYREIEVGELGETALADDASYVRVGVHIREDYVALLRQDSVFWNATGIDIKAGLFGMELRSESLSSVLGGGVAFATPDRYGPAAPAGSEFKLYDKPRDEWLAWSPTIPLKGKRIGDAKPAAGQTKQPGVVSRETEAPGSSSNPDRQK